MTLLRGFWSGLSFSLAIKKIVISEKEMKQGRLTKSNENE